MTSLTKSIAQADTGLGAIAVAALLGVALIWIAGFANASAIHGAAHDSRHAIAMPCH